MECVRAIERMHDPAERAKVLEIAKAYMNLSMHAVDDYEHVTTHRGVTHDLDRHPDDA